MKAKNFIFLLVVLAIITIAVISVAPSIGQMNSSADAINRTIETQRDTNGNR